MELRITYGKKHVGLEFRNALRGFSDEFVNLIVGGPQVRLSLCHLPVAGIDDERRR